MRQEIKDRLLNTVDLKVLHPDECEKSLDKFLTDDMIGYDAADKLIVGEMLHFYNRYHHLCVEGEEKSTCTGDSGGPLICEGNVIYAAYSLNFASYSCRLKDGLLLESHIFVLFYFLFFVA